MLEIKNLEEAEKVREEYPYLFLVSFVVDDNRHGSMVVTAKEDLPLYKVYFMVNEANKEKRYLTILNIIKLS